MQDDEIHIVHISDLQAGEICLAEVESKYFGPGTVKERYAHYARVLAADTISVLKAEDRDPKVHLLVISGDVANKALAKEYSKAEVFLNTLAAEFELKWKDVVIVPGNHDVNWLALKKEWGRRPMKTPEQIKKCGALRCKMNAFKRWVNQLYRKNAVGYRYSFGIPIHFNEISCGQLAVVGFDSCERCVFERKQTGNKKQAPWKFGRGYVNPDQITEGLKKLKAAGPDRIRIAVLHHSPFPDPEPDPVSALEEANDFRERLAKHNVTLILAGHMHCARYSIHTDVTTSDNPVCHTFVTGPCCMQIGERYFTIGNACRDAFPNRYQILSMDLPSFSVDLYLRRFTFERRTEEELGSVRGAWTSDTDPAYVNFCGESFCVLDPTNEKAEQLLKIRFNMKKVPRLPLNDH